MTYCAHREQIQLFPFPFFPFVKQFNIFLSQLFFISIYSDLCDNAFKTKKKNISQIFVKHKNDLLVIRVQTIFFRARTFNQHFPERNMLDYALQLLVIVLIVQEFANPFDYFKCIDG